MGDMVRLAYGHDIVKRTVKTMTEFDPKWQLPDGFFPAECPAAEPRSEPSNGIGNGKIGANVKIQLQEIAMSDGIEAL